MPQLWNIEAEGNSISFHKGKQIPDPDSFKCWHCNSLRLSGNVQVNGQIKWNHVKGRFIWLAVWLHLAALTCLPLISPSWKLLNSSTEEFLHYWSQEKNWLHMFSFTCSSIALLEALARLIDALISVTEGDMHMHDQSIDTHPPSFPLLAILIWNPFLSQQHRMTKSLLLFQSSGFVRGNISRPAI